MAKYICVLCNYSTARCTDLTRHNESLKHKKNENKNINNKNERSSKDPIEIQYNKSKNEAVLYTCQFCNQTFKHKTNFYRHQKKRCVIRLDILNNEKEISELKIQNQKLIEANINNSKANLNNSETNKKTVNTLTYALKNFQDAPILGLLKGKKL